MLCRWPLGFAVALLLANGCSQDDDPGTSRPPSERFADLVASFANSNQQIHSEWQNAVDQNDRAAMRQIQYRMIQMRADHTLAAQSIADEAQDADLVVQALTWIIVNNGRNRHARQAVQRIEAEYRQHPLIGDAINHQMSPGTLTMLAQQSPHDTVRAVATYFVATQETDLDRAEVLLTSIEQQYADVVYRRQPLRELIKKPLKILRHLRVGKIAQEIEGRDVDGNLFRLSDYRGKVVMLDFWGHW